MPKYKHYIIWYHKLRGNMVQYRTSHTNMERLVNQVVQDMYYTPKSLRVIIGVEELKPDGGADLI